MARGIHPFDYFHNPNVQKPQDEIFRDMDSFTDEIWAENVERYGELSVFFLLPPLRHEGRFLKGVLFTHGADLLIEKFPRLKELFWVFAYSMWSSYAWSTAADGLLTLYPNPEREAWFRRTQPARANQILVPLMDSDFVNEVKLAPAPDVKKDIDILCVSRLDALKNAPMIAAALGVYQTKHPGKPARMTWATGRDVDLNWSALDEGAKDILRDINRVLINTPDYITILPSWQSDMRSLYARARCYVVGSLVEGKNRGLLEAMACGTPAVCFADLNKYIRGATPNIPPGGGLEAPNYDPGSLADTLHRVLENPGAFKPREALLRVSGRRVFFNTMLDAIPYYAENLPGYSRGEHLSNPWLNAALQEDRRLDLEAYLYGDQRSLVWVKGLEAAQQVIALYLKHYGVT